MRVEPPKNANIWLNPSVGYRSFATAGAR